jgi:hypothetical protein
VNELFSLLGARASFHLWTGPASFSAKSGAAVEQLRAREDLFTPEEDTTP